MSGYCATGSEKNATPPRIITTMETTEAKIGRSMKKCEKRMCWPPAISSLWRVWLRRRQPAVPVGGLACSSWATTLEPGRMRISPFTTTRSSPVMPVVMTRSPSTTRPSVTYFICGACGSLPGPIT